MTFEYIGQDVSDGFLSGSCTAATGSENLQSRIAMNSNIWASTNLPGFTTTRAGDTLSGCWGIRKELKIGGGGPVWFVRADPNNNFGTPPIQIDKVLLDGVNYAIPQFVLIARSAFDPVLQCGANSDADAGGVLCNCKPGFYGNGDDSGGATGCTPCQEGYWCPGGTGGTAPANICTTPGHYTVPSATASTACGLKCVAETEGCGTQTSATTSSAATCKCGPGYSFALTDSGISIPGVSPTAYFKVNACTTCNQGYEQPNTITTATACTACAAGYYAGGIKTATCPACGLGSSTNAAGTGATACNPCTNGGTASTSANGGPCTVCTAGKYAPDNKSACQNCPAGKDSPSPNTSYGAGTCANCDANKFADGSGVACAPCPGGTASAAGATSCKTYASAETINTYLGGTSGSGMCFAGTYGSGGGSCSACPAGTVSTPASSICTNFAIPFLACQFEGNTKNTITGLAGTITGSISYNSSGKYGQSLVITNQPSGLPQNYVSYQTINSYKAITTAIWVKFNTSSTADQYFLQINGNPITSPQCVNCVGGVCTNCPSGSIRYIIFITGTTNTVGFRVVDRFTTTTPKVVYSSVALTLGQWAHVAVVLDGTTQMIYVNGVPSGSIPCNTTELRWANVKVGGSDVSSRSFLNGELDDVRVYDTAVTPTQIQKIYQSGGNLYGSLPSPSLAWQFEGNTTDTITGLTGTTTGTPTYVSLIYSKAINYPGSSFTNWTAPFTLNTTGLSFSIWINYNNIGTSYVSFVLGPQGGTNLGGYIKLQLSSISQLQVQYIQNSTFNYTSQFNDVTTGTWYHIAYVITAVSATLYKNGIQVSNTPITNGSGLNLFTNDVCLGDASNGGTSIIADDLRIYNSALTSAQILTIYQSDRNLFT